MAGNLPANATVQSAKVRMRHVLHIGSTSDMGVRRQFTAWNSSATWLTPDGTDEWEGGYPKYSYPYWLLSATGGVIEWDVSSWAPDEDAGGYIFTSYDACIGVHGLGADYPPELVIEYET